jgi:hypothetical protein
MCLKDYCSEEIITFTPWAQLAEILPRKPLTQPLTFSMVGSTPSRCGCTPHLNAMLAGLQDRLTCIRCVVVEITISMLRGWRRRRPSGEIRVIFTSRLYEHS